MISFERSLIPTQKLEDGISLESNVLVVLNDRRDYGKINRNHLISVIHQKDIHIQNNYDDVIRLIRTITNNRRMCNNLGGIETRDFSSDNFILISYFTFQNKKYINGFIKVKDCSEYPDIIKTNYICTDLSFSGIGPFVNFFKMVIIEFKIPKLRIKSIIDNNLYITQNIIY